MNKAKFKFSIHDRCNPKYILLFYEYRGREYCVSEPLSWNTDSSCDMQLAVQHRNEQKRIDEMLEKEHVMKQQKYHSSAQEGLDEFFKFFEEV